MENNLEGGTTHNLKKEHYCNIKKAILHWANSKDIYFFVCENMLTLVTIEDIKTDGELRISGLK